MSTGWQAFLRNRYVSLLFDTSVVTAWALWAFRDRSSDDVAACTLVVMISLLVWLEFLTRLGPPVGRWLKRRFGSVTKLSSPTLSASPSFPLKVMARIVLIVLILFLACTVYGIGFLTAAALLRMSPLTWAVETTLRVGIILVETGIVMLLILIVTLLAGALLSVVSWSDLITWIRQGLSRFWIPGSLGEAIKSQDY